jgi:hypothetical protein
MAAKLTPENQARYDAFDTMFATAGWEQLRKEITAEVTNQQVHVLENAKSYDEICEIRGWVRALAFIYELRDILERERSNEEASVEEANKPEATPEWVLDDA